VLEQAFAL